MLIYTVLVIVGNKIDIDAPNGVPYEEAQIYAQSLGALFKYTSAKDGKGIEDLFQIVADKLLESNIGDNEKR